VLCIKAGSSAKRCITSRLGGFNVIIPPGRTQYVTVHIGGKVVGRIVYRHVS
jgi:hypothetical protein